MIDRHEELVDAFVARCASPTSSQRNVDVMDSALAAIWARAQIALGPVMVRAIFARVLHVAAPHAPSLELLDVRADRVGCGALCVHASSIDPRALADALRRVIVEALRVFGSVTSEVLTPALYAELARVTPPSAESPS